MSLVRTPFLMLASAAAALPLLVSSGATYAAVGDVWAVTKEADGPSAKASVPDGGQRAFFSSSATTLVAGDANGLPDAFWVRRDGVVKKVSSTPQGGDANGSSGDVQTSADGRTIAFATTASNLWNSDKNEKRDIYACTSSCFSVGWVAWVPKGQPAEPNGSSMHPRISADGKWLAFASDASNWVAGDTNGVRDVFLANIRSGQVTRVSLSASGRQLTRASDYPAISADGKLVTFATAAPATSKDTNGKTDVYLRDVDGRTTTLQSQSKDEKVANGASGSASVAQRCVSGSCFPTVVFTSHATNLVSGDTNGSRDVFVRERGSTARISASQAGVQGRTGEASWGPSISSDGRWVAFASDADLTGVPQDASDQSQVLVRDRSNGSVRLLSAVGGLPGDADSQAASISPNGKFVAFLSKATNLDTVDTDNGTWDVFVSTVY